MLKNIFTLLLVVLLCNPFAVSQNGKQERCRVAFYNVENFFDTAPDTLLQYNDFTPQGNHYWSADRYEKKRNNIYKVIVALGRWQGVGIMGFAEIENRQVLTDLIKKTPLHQLNYKLVHYESHDHRGIDVGLIYQPAKFTLLYSKAVPLVDTTQPDFHTRDILYVKGLLMGDTLHLFVNHWPSRYGGFMQTLPKRKLAATLLRHLTDSICALHPKANILVMGDFNDNPQDKSIHLLTQNKQGIPLVSLPWKNSYRLAQGSLKHGAQWAVFDQILVTEHLLKNSTGIKTETEYFSIYDAPFLLEKDEKYTGYTTFRTWRGFAYHGGFSDHLPVFIDIVTNGSHAQ